MWSDETSLFPNKNTDPLLIMTFNALAGLSLLPMRFSMNASISSALIFCNLSKSSPTVRLIEALVFIFNWCISLYFIYSIASNNILAAKIQIYFDICKEIGKNVGIADEWLLIIDDWLLIIDCWLSSHGWHGETRMSASGREGQRKLSGITVNYQKLLF